MRSKRMLIFLIYRYHEYGPEYLAACTEPAKIPDALGASWRAFATRENKTAAKHGWKLLPMECPEIMARLEAVMANLANLEKEGEFHLTDGWGGTVLKIVRAQ